MKKELKTIKKYINKNWGKKCKDFSCLCATCIAWRAFETLEELSKVGDYKIVKHKN